MSRLDIVVFGASGFTGQHAVEELARIADQRGLTWAVAGRSQEKLQKILKNISDKIGKDLSQTPVLVADVQDEQSLRAMCARGRLLVNCCGPYTLLGEPLVRAALHSRTHYVDVSGEPNFIELMQLKYNEAARAAGVFVVSACGFESVPADLGVCFLQRNFGGVLNSVECYMSVDTPKAGINNGSWNSLVNSLAHFVEINTISKKTYSKPLPKLTPKMNYRLPFHKRNNGWCLPFPSHDCYAVHRTQRHLYQSNGTRPAQFTNYVRFPSFLHSLAIALAFVFIFIMSQWKVTRKLLIDKSKLFSLGIITDGPSEEQIKKVGFEFSLYGQGWDESDAANMATVPPRKSVIAKVSGVNPGYGATVLALLYSAVAILRDQDRMPPGGGVMSPGMAFANTSLVKNLQDNGVSFQIVHTKHHQD